MAPRKEAEILVNGMFFSILNPSDSIDLNIQDNGDGSGDISIDGDVSGGEEHSGRMSRSSTMRNLTNAVF